MSEPIGIMVHEVRVAVRIEVLAVNDPSFTVALPDPALVVELP